MAHLFARFSIWHLRIDDTKAINITYRFVFVTPIDFTCGCRKGIYIYIYTYNRNTLFGHFKRITLASGSSTRSIQTSGHNEKIFSRPLPSRGSRMDGNRCDATGNQTLPLWFVRFIGRVDLISLPVYILIDDTRSRCRACQESEWWDSTIRSLFAHPTRKKNSSLKNPSLLINRLISNLFYGITAFPLIGWPRKNGIQMIFPVRFPNLFIVNNERRDECTYSVDSCDRCCSSSRVANRSTQTLAVAFFSDTFFFCLSELYFRLATRLRLVPLFHVDKHFSLDKCARLLPRIPVLCSPSRRLFIEEGRQVACCQVGDGRAFVHHVHVIREIDIQNVVIHSVKKKSFFPLLQLGPFIIIFFSPQMERERYRRWFVRFRGPL